MERYYDINGREGCTTAVVTVADRTFRISRVVIAARVMYSNMIIRMGEMLRKLSAYDREADTDGTEGMHLEEEATRFAKDRMETIERVLRLLLEKNGEKWDKAWWDENTDEADRRAFIERCLMKDSGNVDKKKETPEG